MEGKNIRHGDLGIISTNQIPKDAKASKSKVLLTGSHGHEHHINDKGIFYPKKNNQIVIGYLLAKKGCKIFHHEHGIEISKNKPKEVIIPEGCYELRQQQEITHSGMVKVVD